MCSSAQTSTIFCMRSSNVRSETLFFEVSMTTSMSSWHCRFDTELWKLRTCFHTLSQTTTLEGHFYLKGHFPSNSGKKKAQSPQEREL